MPQPEVAHTDTRRAARPASQIGNLPVEGSAGAELFSLCQTATADGQLCDGQLRGLRKWLDQTSTRDVPSYEYVRKLVDHIVVARKVAPPDLHALHSALEASLPADLRRRPAPRVVAREYKARVDDDEVGFERLRNEVLGSAQFMVAGCHRERRASAISRHARVGDPVLLLRERDCPQSPNAIQIRLPNGKQIGSVPERYAAEIAPLLDQGARYRAHLTNLQTGSSSPIVLVQTYLYASDATLGTQSANARKIGSREWTSAWWVVRVAVGLLITLSVAYVLRV